MARVLIVDDSLVMRGKLKAILTKGGHTVVAEAQNGIQAYKEYEKHKPDLVTMDITMPLMDGIDAVKRIIGAFPEAKIIIISALQQKNMILVALENGAKNYIFKPFEADKVLEVVDKVLAGSGSDRQKREGGPESQGAGATGEQTGTQPFSIESKNGMFLINIFQSIGMDTLSSLNAAVQGLLFVKPLKAVFNFGDIEALSNEVLNGILEIMECVRNVGGTLKVISRSEKFIQCVKDRKNDILACCYSNISDID